MRAEHWWYILPLRLRSLFQRARVEQDLDEEIAYHIERQVRENVVAGMSAADARAAAIRSFGGITYQKELARETRGVEVIEHMAQDIRFSVRSLRRRPGFVTAVVVTLALGIGANTAVFSLIDAVLLHPLAVDRPEQLVRINHAVTDRALTEGVSFPQFRAMAGGTRSFEGLAGFIPFQTTVRSRETVDQLSVYTVSGNYFGVLGITPQAGRLLLPSDDDVPGGHHLAVLSDALWDRLFDRRRDAIGAVMQLGGSPYTVVGVAPPDFRGTDLSDAPDLWVPLTMFADIGAGGMFNPSARSTLYNAPNSHFVNLLGRLALGASMSSASAELGRILREQQRMHPPRSPTAMGYPGNLVALPIRLVPIVEAATPGDHGNLTRLIEVLLVIVLLTLLIACVNAANLLLVRSNERAYELTLRALLGAPRRRIVQQLLLESLLLSSLAALVGLGVGGATLRLLSAFTLPGNIELASLHLGLDRRVLEFTALVSIVTAFAFGLVPAWHASRPGLSTMLRASRSSTGPRRSGDVLLGAQVAISLMLLVGAALFVRSLRAGLAADIGFDPRQLAAARVVDPTLLGANAAEVARYYDDALERARHLPGVTDAALSTHVPLAPFPALPFAAGSNPDADAATVETGTVAVSPGFFDLLYVPLLEGRGFTHADDRSAPRIAILNESAARSLFPAGHPVGRDIVHAGTYRLRIVGVVRDTRYETVRDHDRPMLFTPIAQDASGANLIVRSARPRAALVALGRLLATLPPRPPVRDARIVADQIDAALMPQRFGSTLLGLFALVALAISAVGIYSTISYAVGRRTAELGVRIALGAQRGDIVRLVVTRTGAVVAVGIGFGLLLSAVSSRGLAPFLYEVRAVDLAAFVTAGALAVTAAVLASIVPARRAMRIDPLAAIRND